METLSNILDPIHSDLPSTIWDNPGSDRPHLKPQHRKWIESKVHQVLKQGGYTNPDDWVSLVLTGSLTTYQYSLTTSDCDVSLFVDSAIFPEWSRAEMIGLMVSKIDGTLLPGTQYPMQCFVVPPNVKREDLYRPGLRSGYDLKTDEWIVPPDKDRVHNVEQEMNAYYIYALESADKLERLIRYEPDKAIQYWHQIHKRRQRDQRAGKGDYSEANIVYKFLANRGMFDELEKLTGTHIAKISANSVAKFVYDPEVNHLVVGKMGAEEGENESHYDLINSTGVNADNALFGQIYEDGRAQTFGRPKIKGFGQQGNQYEASYRLKQALEHAVPGVHYDTFTPPHDKWENSGPPNVTYMGDPPVFNKPLESQPEGTWTF